MVSIFGKHKGKGSVSGDNAETSSATTNNVAAPGGPAASGAAAGSGSTTPVSLLPPVLEANSDSSALDAGNTSNDANEGNPSGCQAVDSSSSHGLVKEKSDMNDFRLGSCYEGGDGGYCRTCGMSRIACNCQRCYCCDKFLLSLSSRRHCRRCWRAVCPRCASHDRVNHFMNGEVSRTCRQCAVPQAVVFLTQLAYSTYETVEVPRPEGNEGAAEGKEKASSHGIRTAVSADEPMGNPPDMQSLDDHPFRWGLYALASVIDAPRRCIHPRCPNPLSYATICATCKVPTVTTELHHLRHVSVASITTTSVMESVDAIDAAVHSTHDLMASTRSDADDGRLFKRALPSNVDRLLFASLQSDDGGAARQVLLALASCAVAAESRARPHISAALTDTPAYARLLQPLTVAEAFSVFSGPGNTRYITFASCASDRAVMEQVLSPRLSAREVWTSEALRATGSIGRIVAGSQEAEGQQLSECVAQFRVREGALWYGSAYPSMRRLPDVLEKMASDGHTIVLCGHGVGGAIATWVASTVLLERTAVLKGRVLCVSFGAPLVVSHPLSDLLHSEGLSMHFQHFVNASDMVPRLSYVEALLDSGNTNGTASLIGRNESTATATEVREAVVLWITEHEEPRGPALVTSPKNGGKDAFSLSSLSRMVRGSGDRAKAKRDKQMDSAASSITNDATGDIFRTSREPFDNNVSRSLSESASPTERGTADFERFAATKHRSKQLLDPSGCFHFLWHPRGKYLCTNDAPTALALLSDRTNMRVSLQDHLLSSYNKGMLEYVYSVSTAE